MKCVESQSQSLSFKCLKRANVNLLVNLHVNARLHVKHRVNAGVLNVRHLVNAGVLNVRHLVNARVPREKLLVKDLVNVGVPRDVPLVV